MKNKWELEQMGQMDLTIPTETGGQRKLQIAYTNVGTADEMVGSMLKESIRLRANGGCWCKVLAKQRKERHSVKRCKCRCHVKT